jgi:PKD repeat protein
VLAAGLLAFKVANNNVVCHTVMITVKPAAGQPETDFYIGEKLSFHADMAKAKTVEWDFGDGTPTATGADVVHAYSTDGAYLVTTTVNGKCTESVSILVRQLATTTLTSPSQDSSLISGPDAPMAGEPVRFTAAGAAQSYEWTVLNAPDFPVQREPSAIYIFPAAGTRVIEVKLDNDPAKTYRKTITVLPSNKPMDAPTSNNAAVPPPVIAPPPVKEAPATTTPDAPKVLIIPDEEFSSMLTAVTEGKKDASSFSAFLCNGAQTKVLVNGSDWQTFGELISKIHDNKKYVIRSVESVRNEQNCVTLLKVRYKKKGLLGL